MDYTEIQTALSFSQRGPSEGRPLPEGFYFLVKSWFSQRRSTEAMMRGTSNEPVVLKTLHRYTWIEDVFIIGMVCSTTRPWNACSPYGLAILAFRHEPPDEFEWGTYMAVKVQGRRYPIPCVETKAAVSRQALNPHIITIGVDLHMKKLGV